MSFSPEQAVRITISLRGAPHIAHARLDPKMRAFSCNCQPGDRVEIFHGKITEEVAVGAQNGDT